MLKRLLVCAIVLVCGTFPPCCFAGGDAVPPGKDKPARFRLQIDLCLKLPAKTALNEVQTLAYHQYRELAEPKLYDIFRRLQGTSQDDRNKARQEIRIVKSQIQDDLDLLVSGLKKEPGPAGLQPGIAPPAPAGNNAVRPVASDSDTDSGDGSDQQDDIDTKRMRLRNLLDQDVQLRIAINYWKAPIKALETRLSQVQAAQENALGDPRKLQRDGSSLERLLETMYAGQENMLDELIIHRQEETELAADLGETLPPWLPPIEDPNGNSIEKKDAANQRSSVPAISSRTVARRKAVKKDGVWSHFGMDYGGQSLRVPSAQAPGSASIGHVGLSGYRNSAGANPNTLGSNPANLYGDGVGMNQSVRSGGSRTAPPVADKREPTTERGGSHDTKDDKDEKEKDKQRK